MTFMNWQDYSYSMESLRRDADYLEPWNDGAYHFLQNAGYVPWDVQSVAATKVRLNIALDAIPAGYLASAAYEWDSWGPSQPSDFLDAIEAELNPAKRDLIAAVLTSLGRSVSE